MGVNMGHRRDMPRRPGVGEGTVGKPQSLVNLTEHPQRGGVKNLCRGQRILTEAAGEVAMPHWVVECEGLLKMLVGAGKVAQIPTGAAEYAVRDDGFGAIGPGRGFAQEKLGDFAQRCGFAADQMPRKKTVIGGKPF